MAGRPPNAVDPTSSAAAALGAELRALRMEKGWTLETLGRKTGYTPQHVSSIELARSSCGPTFVDLCDKALGARGRLSGMLLAVVIERAFERDERTIARRKAATLDDDVKRRAFLGLGLAAVILGPEAAARALSDAESEQIAFEWSREIVTAPDRRALLPGLTADLKRLRTDHRVVAQLGSYVAAIAVSSGDPVLARRWWRRSRAAAVASGDSHLLAYVAGRQAMQGVHGVYSPAQIVLLANDALAATAAPCTGRMHALGARVQAQALLGRQKQARAALHDLERAFERLPRDITRERATALGWPEDRLHYWASFVGSCFGTPYDATGLYPSVMWSSYAEVQLHLAAAEVDPAHAVAVLSKLGDAQRPNQFVQLTARRVLDTCERRGARVAELREVLA